MQNYEDLFQEHLLDGIENKALTDIKEMLEKKVESLTKMVVDRNASINRLSETISRMVVNAQEKEQELREKERVLSDRYDIIAKQIDKIVVLRDAIHCMQGEAREKDVALMKQAEKILKLQQQRAEIYEASKEWVAMYGTSTIMPSQTLTLLNKLKEIFTYDRYHINEETNEWVVGCEKRVGYDDSQGQTPPGYGSTEPTRKTPGSPKQSYDYRKVGL